MFQSQLNNPLNPLAEYLITQFQPDRIVMQHSKTKAKFFYKEITLTHPPHLFLKQLQQRASIQHDNLINIHYHHWKENTIGVLSEYYQTHLESEIQKRGRMKQARRGNYALAYFTQQQLINTFSPVISCLNLLHSSKLAHGFLKSRSIIVNESFQTKLCDAILLNHEERNRESVLSHAYFPPEFQYNNDISVEGDLWALGMIILEATILECLEPFYDRSKGKVIVNEIQKKIEDIHESFSDQYIVGIKLLLSSDKTIRKDGISVIIDGAIPEGIIYEKMRPQRKKDTARCYDSESPKKVTRSENKEVFGLTLNSSQLQSGKLYKPQVLNQSNNHTEDKKTKTDFIKQKYRSRNTEEMEIKKKQIEKINKIIERSNAFVNELIAKRNDKPLKIPSLGKTSINFNVPGGYKKQFFNENSKRPGRTPGKDKEELEREKLTQGLLSNSFITAEIQSKTSSCKQSPKKLYLKRQQPQKLKSLSKKK